MTSTVPLTQRICKSFNAQAATYEKAAVIQHAIGKRLFERLSYFKIKPRYILDLGCGSGSFSACLQAHYPTACVVGLDVAYQMLHQARLKETAVSNWVNGDMGCLPFASGMFDLVFANQVLHWTDSLPLLFRELSRVMNVDGCLMFSTLGVDTFQEIKQSWAKVDQHAHVNAFMDMHDIGDCLLSEQWLDPVVDMESITAHYGSLSQLLLALKKQGVRNVHPARPQGLTGKKAWQAFEQAMALHMTAEGKYPLSYEVIYGHAWKGNTHRVKDGTETYVSVSSMTPYEPASCSEPGRDD